MFSLVITVQVVGLANMIFAFASKFRIFENYGSFLKVYWVQ